MLPKQPVPGYAFFRRRCGLPALRALALARADAWRERQVAAGTLRLVWFTDGPRHWGCVAVLWSTPRQRWEPAASAGGRGAPAARRVEAELCCTLVD